VHCPEVLVSSLLLRLRRAGLFVLDNIRADGRAEDGGKRMGFAAAGAISAQDADSRATRHLECVEMCRLKEIKLVVE